MNVEGTNAASENWDELFKDIRLKPVIILRDSQADRYDFANPILMRRMRERLVETLQGVHGRIGPLTFGNKFFMTMNEQEQQDFFRSIFNVRATHINLGEATNNHTESPAITISTSALIETLPELRLVRFLNVSNFALTRPSDVQALSNIISSKPLRHLALESIECPLDDSNRKGSDESDRFLDPLFYAAPHVLRSTFRVSTKAHSIHLTLVSPRPLRALFVKRTVFQTLSLRGLGLTDSHVLAIVDGLSTPGIHLDYLNLECNPGITAQGYDALFNFINRADVVDYGIFNKAYRFSVDDKAWEGKLNLVSEMNSRYHHREYLTNCTFTSEERRWQWLERVTELPNPYRELCKEWDAKHLNFIWYTLCQNPEMIQVSQAPTRSRKRKGM
jgi:hypothetical protein